MINVDHQITAVTRTVGRQTLEVGEGRVVTIAQSYPTTVDDLWDACTNAERLPRWFLPVSGDLRVGGQYQLEGNAGGTIESCDPPRSFSATWEFGGGMSWIEVRITPDGDGSRFELAHTMHVDDHWNEYGPGATGVGWDGAMLGLSLHIANAGATVDAAVDAAEFERWSLSDDGKRFNVLASERWADAGIAGGEDRAWSLEASARTTAFYTGEEAPES